MEAVHTSQVDGSVNNNENGSDGHADSRRSNRSRATSRSRRQCAEAASPGSRRRRLRTGTTHSTGGDSPERRLAAGHWSRRQARPALEATSRRAVAPPARLSQQPAELSQQPHCRPSDDDGFLRQRLQLAGCAGGATVSDSLIWLIGSIQQMFKPSWTSEEYTDVFCQIPTKRHRNLPSVFRAASY